MSLLNTTINRLGSELHLPGYSFCGPGTKLQERLSRGEKGINKLDQSCREHDISYSQSTSLEDRHKADDILIENAWKRVRAKDSSVGEKLSAWVVTNLMKTKRALGMGRRRQKRNTFNKVVNQLAKHISLKKPTSVGEAIILAKNFVKKKKIKKVKIPRVIPIRGGFLPLILAGLSALGAITGGVSAVTNAINRAKSAEADLQESKRHNQKMEAILLGKGLYLSPYKKGLGLHVTKN